MDLVKNNAVLNIEGKITAGAIIQNSLLINASFLVQLFPNMPVEDSEFEID